VRLLALFAAAVALIALAPIPGGAQQPISRLKGRVLNDRGRSDLRVGRRHLRRST
jgi:hypothetical protein